MKLPLSLLPPLGIIITTTLFARPTHAGNLKGYQWVTLRSFEPFYEPNFCGIMYDTLERDFLTAVENLQEDQCGKCLMLCGEKGCEWVLAVDRGGRGLDISKGLKGKVVGNHDDAARVEWGETADHYCDEIRHHKPLWTIKDEGKRT